MKRRLLAGCDAENIARDERGRFDVYAWCLPCVVIAPDYNDGSSAAQIAALIKVGESLSAHKARLLIRDLRAQGERCFIKSAL